MECLRQIRKAKSTRKMKKAAKRGEVLVASRQEWLMIAERYGHSVASLYEQGGELMAVVGNSSKQKRLLAAIQADSAAAKKQRSPSLSSSHGSAVSHSSTAASVGVRPSVMSGKSPSGGPCHRCGQYGHYVKYCPQQIPPLSQSQALVPYSQK